MVSMAVSTVSVIESIVVIRLCTLNDNATPLPPVVRLIAFRVLNLVLSREGMARLSSPHRISSGRPCAVRLVPVDQGQANRSVPQQPTAVSVQR